MQDYTAIEYEHAALLLIDMQEDFVSGPTAVEGTTAVLPNVAALAAAFRSANRPIVHVIRYYQPGGSDVDSVRRASIEQGALIAAPASPGASIPVVITGAEVDLDHEALLSGKVQAIGGNEFVLYKPRWSAFHRTVLDSWLRDRAITSLIVGGCNLPNCPRATLFDATERDYRAAIAADAVSQVTAERLRDLELIGVHIEVTTDIAAAVVNAGQVLTR